VDKKGNEVLFLDPESYNVIASIKGFALRVHELLISEDHTRAFVPIYGDGIHGNNPNPGHLIAVIDLIQKRHIGDFSVAPYEAPHGMRWGSRGQLYCICAPPRPANLTWITACRSPAAGVPRSQT